MAQTDHPDLFLDDSGQTPQEAEDLQHANQKKQDRIHAEIKKLRTGPDGEMKMSFQKTWGLLRQQKPQLLNFDEAPVSSRPYAQDLPGTQQPAIRMATIRAEKAIADGVAYIEVSSEDYADLLSGKYAQVQGGLVRRKSRRRDPALPPNTGAGVYNISLGRQQMNVAILTLFEGHHHMGVGALINSLKTKTGFKGTVYVFYRGSPPPWESLFTNGPGIEDIKVVLKHIAPSRFLGYHKPFAALEVLERDPELDGVIYADPDVVFLASWPFFEEWLNSGVALCLDWSHAWLHPNHPWRYKWKELVRRAGLKVVRECGEYPNGGFFGVTRSRSNVLKNWVTATLEFEKEGGIPRSMTRRIDFKQ